MAAAAATGIGGGSLSSGCTHRPLCRPPPFLLLAVPHYPTIQPILFGWDSSHSLYAVIARPGGDIGVRMDRHEGVHHSLSASSLLSLSLFLTIYLSICFSSPSRIYRSIVRTRASRLFLPFPFHRFYLLIARPPPSPILPSDYGEMRGARFMDEGDPRNSAAEELPIPDMRADAYTRTSPERASGSIVGDLRVRAREIIQRWCKKKIQRL